MIWDVMEALSPELCSHLESWSMGSLRRDLGSGRVI